VHGLGLFAGEYFEQGDLIGSYSGILMTNEDINVATRLGDALEKVYTFGLTDNMSIDGEHLGTKAKFINEYNEGSEELANCEAKFSRCRGDARIALTTTRRVQPGEEFLFNYQMQKGIGSEWSRTPYEEEGPRSPQRAGKKSAQKANPKGE